MQKLKKLKQRLTELTDSKKDKLRYQIQHPKTALNTLSHVKEQIQGKEQEKASQAP